MKILERQKVQVLGGEGLAVVAERKDPVKHEKVKSKVVFGKRGDRVVAFYITQWRPIDGSYDLSAFEIFDKFVSSFKKLIINGLNPVFLKQKEYILVFPGRSLK